ncbi:MAG: hypothetical protein ACD_79C00111G0003 [uncultured bacterium]|nr:MAG: hypothetical protein ACD_79C00111G0003 [uncultured bacterium]
MRIETITVFENPTVELISPINGDVIETGNPITMTINAQKTDGYISKIEIYDNAMKIATIAIDTATSFPC